MATVNFTAYPARDSSGGIARDAFIVEWLLGQGDDGTPFYGAKYNDKSVEISGTFAAGTVAIQGSDRPLVTAVDDWNVLNDPQGNALTGVAAAKIEQLLENTARIRPVVTGGGGTTAIRVWLLCKTVSSYQ